MFGGRYLGQYAPILAHITSGKAGTTTTTASKIGTASTISIASKAGTVSTISIGQSMSGTVKAA